MAPCCYILFSKSLNRFYVGSCHLDLLQRIEKHNSHFYGNNRFTAAANDWLLFLRIPAKDYPHATRMEKLIKSMKSSTYIRNLILYPQMIDNIITKTSN
ncbi:MAG TPA: hypothetical protein DCR43_05050 [Bacteroidales bacterium]|nr:hypothetical protein [Bacteroidales bacterium]